MALDLCPDAILISCAKEATYQSSEETVETSFTNIQNHEPPHDHSLLGGEDGFPTH
ncbi:615_t:CDS:2 [Paraglomus brasilianum]|uniref:615_t:CDS:1 n=1 Tax=Paraglomus brasilianum TaxID=144538 RepID=A0A9N9G6W1_9GLOM|nr:615_t:CDS:2 [Paraglomus brasilianum]